MDELPHFHSPRKPFQFGLIDLCGVVFWAATVLGAWRCGLLQPQLMPIIFPIGSGLGVAVVLVAVKRFRT